MIFATNNQLNCFILFLFFGILIGIIFQLIFIIIFKKNKKIWKNIIIDTIFCTIFLIVFDFLLNFYNFGKFSFVLIFAYLFGYFWIKKLSKKIVDKCAKVCYNKRKGKVNDEELKPKN